MWRLTLCFLLFGTMYGQVVVNVPDHELSILDDNLVSKMEIVPFTVTGERIDSLSVESACSCVNICVEKNKYLVGENGSMLLFFSLSELQGLKRYTLKCSWTEGESRVAKSSTFDVSLRLPIAYSVSVADSFPKWNIGDVSEKIVPIKLIDKGILVDSITEGGGEQDFSTSIRRNGDDAYEMAIKPLTANKFVHKYVYVNIKSRFSRLTKIRIQTQIANLP